MKELQTAKALDVNVTDDTLTVDSKQEQVEEGMP